MSPGRLKDVKKNSDFNAEFRRRGSRNSQVKKLGSMSKKGENNQNIGESEYFMKSSKVAQDPNNEEEGNPRNSSKNAFRTKGLTIKRNDSRGCSPVQSSINNNLINNPGNLQGSTNDLRAEKNLGNIGNPENTNNIDGKSPRGMS